MKTIYKMTDSTMRTYGGMEWELGVPAVKLNGTTLCQEGIYHAYEHPLIAAFISPVHTEYGAGHRLFRGATPMIVKRDGWMKCGCHQITLLEEVALPKLPTNVRVRVAIKLAMRICRDPLWTQWATEWLTGEPICRAEWAARAAEWAAREAEWVAAREAEREAEWVARETEWAARAAEWAAREAERAARAAERAARAAARAAGREAERAAREAERAAPVSDIINLIEECIHEESKLEATKCP